MLSFLRVQRKVPLLTVSPRNVVLPVCSREGSSPYYVSKECCPSCVFKGRFLSLLCLQGMLSFLCVQRKVPLLTVSLRNVVLPVCSKEGSSSYCVSEECCPSCVFKGRFLFLLCFWGMLSFLCVQRKVLLLTVFLRDVVLPVCSKEGSYSYCVLFLWCRGTFYREECLSPPCLVSAWWWTSRWLWLMMTVLPFWQCSNLSYYICNISRIYRPHQSRHSVSNCWARFSGHGNSWHLLFLLFLLQPLLGRPLTSWRPTTGGDCRRRGSEVSCYRVFYCSSSFSSSRSWSYSCSSSFSSSRSWSYSCSSSSFSCSSYSSSSSSYCGMPVRRDRLAFLTGLYMDFSPYLSPPSSIPVWT